jgi:hypothetical protein
MQASSSLPFAVVLRNERVTDQSREQNFGSRISRTPWIWFRDTLRSVSSTPTELDPVTAYAQVLRGRDQGAACPEGGRCG